MKTYPLVRHRPVARFYYQGNHTHPVRRTVLLIESRPKFIRGYELREGKVVRQFGEAPIKTYTRSKIAPSTPYQRRKKKDSRKLAGPLTLERTGVVELVLEGA